MSKPSIHIRTANLQDQELLASLGARTFREAFASDNTPEDMSDYLAKAFGPDRQAAELAIRHSSDRRGRSGQTARARLAGPAPDCIQGLIRSRSRGSIPSPPGSGAGLVRP
jgi:hypothetical protein